MTDFNNRIDAQRDILQIINNANFKEELYGLSSGAIARWLRENAIEQTSPLSNAVRLSAEKLFFLANKSQEQITEEYRHLSLEISELTEHIRQLIRMRPIT